MGRRYCAAPDKSSLRSRLALMDLIKPPILPLDEHSHKVVFIVVAQLHIGDRLGH